MYGGCGPRGGFPGAMFAMRGGRHGGWGRHGFGGGDWGGWGGGGHRHGRRGRMFDGGELRLVLLKLIADEPRHGYDLIRAVEELTEGAYAPSPGVVYPTLTMLQDMDLIAEAGEGGPRKAFSITEAGRAHLEEKADEVSALFDRLEGAGHRRRAGGAPIQRAVGNLLSAVWHRVTRDGIDEKTLHDIAAILDEAAQKIERVKGGDAGGDAA
jgi:DNA-binding PadR family transcriptional regulator